MVAIALPIFAAIMVLLFCIMIALQMKRADHARLALAWVRDVVDTAGSSDVQGAPNVAASLTEAVKKKVRVSDAYELAEAVQEKAAEVQVTEGREAPVGRVAKFVAFAARFGVKLRILVSSIQVLTQLGVAFDITYPDFYSQMLSWLGSINLSVGALPFACLFPSASSYYFELLTKTMLPIIVVSTCMLGSWALQRAHPSANQITGRQRPLGLFVADILSDLWFFTLFLLYPSVCSSIFKYFVAEAFDGDGEDGLRLLRVDRAIDMSSPTYSVFFFYALIMMVLFPIGVPFLYALLLYRSRHTLRELRRVELVQATEYQTAMLKADGMMTANDKVRADNTASAA